MTEFMDRQIRLQQAGQKEYTEEEVRLIINGAIQEEREACSRLCEEYAHKYAKDDDDSKAQAWMMLQCAAAIRARGLDNLNKEAEQNGEQL